MNLFVFARFEVVKLPSALALEGVVLRFVPIDTTIIKIESLDFVFREVEWNKLHRTAYNAPFQVVDILRSDIIQAVREHYNMHRALLF